MLERFDKHWLTKGIQLVYILITIELKFPLPPSIGVPQLSVTIYSHAGTI